MCVCLTSSEVTFWPSGGAFVGSFLMKVIHSPNLDSLDGICCVSTGYSNSPHGRFRWKETHERGLLTCFVDAWVVAELQHVEVSSLYAAPNAVDASDVGALALHRKQGSHHVFVAVMLEFGAPRQEPHQPQQEGSELATGAPLLHRRAVQHRRGGRTKLLDVCMRLHAPHILLYSLLDALFLLYCLLPHPVLTPRSEQGRPPAPSLSPSLPTTAASLTLFGSL